MRQILCKFLVGICAAYIATFFAATPAKAGVLTAIISMPYAFGKNLCYRYVYRHKYHIPLDAWANPVSGVKRLYRMVGDTDLQDSDIAWTMLVLAAAESEFHNGVSMDAFGFKKRSRASLLLEQNPEFNRALDDCSREIGVSVNGLVYNEMKWIDYSITMGENAGLWLVPAGALTKWKLLARAPKIVKWAIAGISVFALAGTADVAWQSHEQSVADEAITSSVQRKLNSGETPARAFNVDDPNYDDWSGFRDLLPTFIAQCARESSPNVPQISNSLKIKIDFLMAERPALEKKLASLKTQQSLRPSDQRFKVEIAQTLQILAGR